MIVDVDFHSVYFTRLIFVSLIKLITLKCMQHKLKQSNMIKIWKRSRASLTYVCTLCMCVCNVVLTAQHSISSLIYCPFWLFCDSWELSFMYKNLWWKYQYDVSLLIKDVNLWVRVTYVKVENWLCDKPNEETKRNFY